MVANVNIYIDIDYRMKKTSGGDIKKTNTQETIAQSIKTILGTTPGERVMLPSFGSYLKLFLFEPMTEENMILMQVEIEKRLAQWEDRIRVTNVYIEPDYDKNYYKVFVEYVHIESNSKYYTPLTLKSFA